MTGHRKFSELKRKKYEMQLFEYAVILQPKIDKDGDTKEEGSVVVPVTSILAQDEKQATMIASRAIPEEFIKKMDRLTVVVRPF